MRVLLTGSSGWLGRYLAPLLSRSGHDVTGLDVIPCAYTQVVGKAEALYAAQGWVRAAALRARPQLHADRGAGE